MHQALNRTEPAVGNGARPVGHVVVNSLGPELRPVGPRFHAAERLFKAPLLFQFLNPEFSKYVSVHLKGSLFVFLVGLATPRKLGSSGEFLRLAFLLRLI